MTDRADDRRPTGPPHDERTLSPRQQWVVITVLVTMLVVIPAAILVWPPTLLSFRDAYLALSLVPGLVLGTLILWLATRRR